jgi:excisionase family DNA binding protein
MNKVITVRELSNYLRVHPTTVYRLLKNGKLPAFKVGSDWRFNVEAIDLWRRGQDSMALAEQNISPYYRQGNAVNGKLNEDRQQPWQFESKRE